MKLILVLICMCNPHLTQNFHTCTCGTVLHDLIYTVSRNREKKIYAFAKKVFRVYGGGAAKNALTLKFS